MIITIKGQEDKVLEAESTIKSALDREIIKHWEPEDLHLEAFLAGLLVPRSEPKFYFEVSSTLAAKLVSMTNINTRSDKKGLYFGKDRHTQPMLSRT
jgi:hypothetical protein